MPTTIRAIALIVFGMTVATSVAEILINEIDVDQIGTDSAEFVEIINTGPSSVNFNTDPHVLVFFNGGDNTPPVIDGSYRNVQLAGALGPGEVLLVGANSLPDVDIILGSGGSNLIQNGTDAVALYRGSSADWSGQHPPTQVNLVDAIVYDTDDPNDIALQQALGVSAQFDEWNEQEAPGVVFSIARLPGGGSFQTGATPTPGRLNDLSPPVFATPGVTLLLAGDAIGEEVVLRGQGGLAPLSARVLSLPSHGQLFDDGVLVIGSGNTAIPYDPDGVLTFVPEIDFSGVDEFEFLMVDAEGRESPPARQELAVQLGGVVISEMVYTRTDGQSRFRPTLGRCSN